jgi:hypothetical protein
MAAAKQIANLRIIRFDARGFPVDARPETYHVAEKWQAASTRMGASSFRHHAKRGLAGLLPKKGSKKADFTGAARSDAGDGLKR